MQTQLNFGLEEMVGYFKESMVPVISHDFDDYLIKTVGYIKNNIILRQSELGCEDFDPYSEEYKLLDKFLDFYNKIVNPQFKDISETVRLSQEAKKIEEKDRLGELTEMVALAIVDQLVLYMQKNPKKYKLRIDDSIRESITNLYNTIQQLANFYNQNKEGRIYVRDGDELIPQEHWRQFLFEGLNERIKKPT